MKKLVLSIAMCFVLFVSGLALTGCFGQRDTFNISVENNAAPVTVTILDDERILMGQPEDNKQNYVVSRNSNITVEIRCAEEGYDLSGLCVEVNGETQNLNKKSFDVKNGKTLYANFLFGRVKKDYDIVVSGVREISTKFNLQKVYNEETDEETNQKLNLTEICFENEDGKDYVNLGTFLAGAGEKNFTHEFDKEETDPVLNKFQSFRIRFVGGDIIQLPEWNLTVENSPFVLQAADGTKKCVASFIQNNDTSSIHNQFVYYVVDMGEEVAKEAEWTLLVDFSKVEYKQFEVIAPEENLVYDVTGLPDFAIYNDLLQFSVKKTNTSYANYEGMEVYINDKKLSPKTQTDDLLTFEVQAKTPDDWKVSDSDYEWGNCFAISVKGIQLSNTHKLTYSITTQENGSNRYCFTPYFKTVSTGGDLNSVLAKDDDGNALTNEQLKNAILWEYAYDADRNAYNFGYDIYDYSVSVQKGVGPETELFNLKTILSEQTNDFEKKEDVECDLGDGRTFKATFNRTTAKFDKFRIEFVATEDVEFVFNQFKRYSKFVKLGFDVPDRVLSAYSSVQYAVLDGDSGNVEDLQYSVLSKGQPVTVAVKDGDVIYLKFSILSSVYAEDFEFFNELVCEGSHPERSDNNVVYQLTVAGYQYGASEEDAQELTLKYIGIA